MKIQVTDLVNQDSYERVVELLIKYNHSKTEQFSNEINKPIEVLAWDDKNDLIGGLYGRSIWGTLEIKTFVVRQDNRNQGIGRKLILEAEKEAKKRNCRFISLDTFSFQAPEFYEKLGFEKIGTETDFPKGFNKYYFRKKI